MKKILKIFLYTILGIILLVLVISYFSYKSYWATDPDVAIDSTHLSYFHETYVDCRNAFIENTSSLSSLYDSVESGKFFVESKFDSDLTVDWCYIPAQKNKEKLLILTSGLHGVEGFTGSAIQDMFIEKILPECNTDNIGILFIHGMNPYGFKYRRKVTGSNVDLNRNCVVKTDMFSSKNEGYEQLTGLLMPEGKIKTGNLRNQFFHMVAIYKIIQKSMPVLRQAALQGQYEFEKGIYYGGTAYEPQIDSVKPLLIDKISGYKTLLNVDLHTAYGERGRMHLFINPVDDEQVLHGIETIFKDVEIDWGSGADFYTINGEYTGWINNLVPEVLCLPMLFEFGTMDSQKTFGSLKSIQVMINENQGVHYGYKNQKVENKVKDDFSEMYYPTSAIWRSNVIDLSYEMMSMMMENYDSFKVDVP